MKVVLVGDNREKIDIVDRMRRKGDGPVIGDFESMRETQHAIALVAKSGKPRRTKWLMDTGCGHGTKGGEQAWPQSENEFRGHDFHVQRLIKRLI